VLAVILNWNGIKHVLRCVSHLRAQVGAAAQILVVDNGSTDDSVAKLRALQPACDVLELGANRGFAEGMNTGLRRAIDDGFEYVWLVNSDAFPAPDCLSALLAEMRADPALMMVTPRLVCEDGSEQHAGGTVDWRNGDLAFLYSAELSKPVGDEFWLTGTAPLIRTASLESAGLLEPAFFAYWEDADLCARLTRAGGRLKAVPAAVAIHLGNASLGAASPIIQFLSTRNAWLFLERNIRTRSRRACWLRFVASSMRRAGVHELRSRPDASNAVLAGISAARLRRFGPPPRVLDAASLERWTFHVRWRWSDALERLADWIEPEGRTKPSPGSSA
jgi:GT2 family glycosyltransferase